MCLILGDMFFCKKHHNRKSLNVLFEFECIWISLWDIKATKKERQQINFVHCIYSWKNLFYIIFFSGVVYPVLCIFTVLNICQNWPIFKYRCKSLSWTKKNTNCFNYFSAVFPGKQTKQNEKRTHNILCATFKVAFKPWDYVTLFFLK